jgi:hypothetical protein
LIDRRLGLDEGAMGVADHRNNGRLGERAHCDVALKEEAAIVALRASYNAIVPQYKAKTRGLYLLNR